MRHWRALLRKQVLPVLWRPVPTVRPEGQDVSITPVYNCFPLDGDSAGDLDVAMKACVAGLEGGGLLDLERFWGER